MTTHDIMWHLANLMTKYGLIRRGWTFKLNNRKRSLGVCKYGPRRIEISRHIISLPREQIIDTILHEIAHALVGGGHGHNHVWKAMCRKIGCRPERLAPVSMDVEPKYYLSCVDCDAKWPRHRRPKRGMSYTCTRCKKQGKQGKVELVELP
jgi:predicted SprT family Zn-dependent metalloprotease